MTACCMGGWCVPTAWGPTLQSVDESGLKDIPGFVQVVRRGNFLGVVAETEWGAIQAAAKLGSTLNPRARMPARPSGRTGTVCRQMDQIWETVRKTAGGTNTSVASQGSVETALGLRRRTLKATYKTPFQMHGSIGPSCAVADVRGDRATFWSGTQMPHETRRDMAQAARHSARKRRSCAGSRRRAAMAATVLST